MQSGRVAAETLDFSLIWFSGIQPERKSSAMYKKRCAVIFPQVKVPFYIQIAQSFH